jgi:hypothetical protein
MWGFVEKMRDIGNTCLLEVLESMTLVQTLAMLSGVTGC